MAISKVLPVCGRDDAARLVPQRVAVGQRLGVGDVEGGAADAPLGQHRHEVVGDDVARPGRRSPPTPSGCEQLEPAPVEDARRSPA